MYGDIVVGTYQTKTHWYIVTEINIQRINRVNGDTEYIAGLGSNSEYACIHEIELNMLRSGRVNKVQ